ncbi:Histidine kinase [Rhodovastum atsumiense]|nr:Histidine kinase [Rhodovastum atsumiense]
MCRSLPPLRTLLAFTFSTVALLAAVATALLGGHDAADRIAAREMREMERLASQFGGMLVQGEAIHLAGLRAAAQMPALRHLRADDEERRALLRAVSEAYPGFNQVSLLRPDGRVIMDAWDAQRGSVTAADHAASGIAPLPGFGVPVSGADGRLFGMLAARLSPEWMRDMMVAFRAMLREPLVPEIMVLRQDGTVLLGPPGLEGSIVPVGAGLQDWPDGTSYLVGTAAITSSGAFPERSLLVMTRLPAGVALAPVRQLQRQVALAAGVAAALAGGLGWLLARAIARPGEALATAARFPGDAAGQGPGLGLGSAWYREAREVAVGLRGLVVDMRRIARHRAEVEARLQELNTTLEQRVAERTAALEAATQQLAAAQRLEAIGKLTGGVAHGINNLLQVIETGLTLLHSSDDSARRRVAEASMAKAVDRGARLTRQLLAFARQQSLAPQLLDPGRLLEESRDLLAQSLRDDIRLTMDIAADTWPVMVDRTQLEVALLNIAVNARDAMPAGGHLHMATANVTFPDTATAPDGLAGRFVRIAVTDNGEGMPAEVLGRAFEPFFTTKDPSRGSGLGLSQVWGFARQSGGTARIESRLGGGTTVTLLLPRADGPVMDEKGVPATPAAEEGQRMVSVLLVEDDPDVAELLSEVLETLGHRVRHLPTGAAALEAIKRGERPDVVITDMMMPGGVNGLALARELRARLPHLPVVLATGYSEKAAEVQEAGVPVLHKPFRAAELEAVLEQVIRGGGMAGAEASH